MQVEHVYTGSVHSDNRGRLQMLACKHRTGLMPQMPHCALLGGVLHELTAKTKENTQAWMNFQKHTTSFDEVLQAQYYTKSIGAHAIKQCCAMQDRYGMCSPESQLAVNPLIPLSCWICLILLENQGCALVFQGCCCCAS